jgi:hypothetical protein
MRMVMGIVKIEDIIGWDTNRGVFCADCESGPDDDADPIQEGDFDPSEYVVTCDRCNRRLV